MYQRFVRFCLPEYRDEIRFESGKSGSLRYSKEVCSLHLIKGDKKTTYILNSKTRLFEQQKRINKDIER